MNYNLALVLLPDTQWHSLEHSTLVYCGTTWQSRVSPSMMHQQAISLASRFTPVLARVTDHAMFGDEHDQPVAVLHSGMLPIMRYVVEWMNASEFPYRPHISAQNGRIRPLGSVVMFDRIAVWCGDDRTGEYYLGDPGRES